MQSIDDILKEMGGKACSAPVKTNNYVVSEKSNVESFKQWIRDESTVKTHFSKLELERKLGPRSVMSSSKVVKLKNVLPLNVAEGALSVLKQCNDWEVSDASYDTGKKDYGAGSTLHRFNATAGNNDSQNDCLKLLYDALGKLIPGKQFAFQGGKYGSGDFIEAHDDAAYIDIDEDNSETVLYSRSIAIVYYLCKDWSMNDGGCFIDHQSGQVIVPEFNTLVAFHVPRLHSVEAVRAHQKFRYSIFGWFLEPGKLYDLFSSNENPSNGKKKKRNKHKNKRNKDNNNDTIGDAKRQKF